MPTMIDTHVHLWDPAVLDYPWLQATTALDRTYVIEDFVGESGLRAPAKYVFVECGCRADWNLREVEWAEGMASADPRLAGIVANVAIERGLGIEGELECLAAKPLVKGIRRILQGEREPGFCLQPEFVSGIKLLARHRFSFDLCIRADQLPDVTRLVQMVPEVQFVLDHFGKPSVVGGQLEPWATEIQELAICPNVVCKVSGLTTEADWTNWAVSDLEPYFQQVIESFGPGRMLFGGDWPVVNLAANYERWIETVEELLSSWGQSDTVKVFQTNAEDIYRI